jgi:hypothetical protein
MKNWPSNTPWVPDESPVAPRMDSMFTICAFPAMPLTHNHPNSTQRAQLALSLPFMLQK